MDFKSLLHKVHMGKELTQQTEVIGVFLGVPYPVSYNNVGYPVMPGGVVHCTSCHEDNLAWKAPTERNHPASPQARTKVWSVACKSCHDSSTAEAHIELNATATGAEACGTCHNPDDELSVERVHRGPR